MQIFIGTINHRHGMNTYAAKSEAGLRRQLAGFCRTWWKELDSDEDCTAMDDQEVIEAYFEAQEGREDCSIDTADLED